MGAYYTCIVWIPPFFKTSYHTINVFPSQHIVISLFLRLNNIISYIYYNVFNYFPIVSVFYSYK